MRGANLRATREKLGLSQAQLARDWGISPRMVRKLETSEQVSPLYAGAAADLRRGLVRTPDRRLRATGEPVAVRRKGGGTIRRTPREAGREVARLQASTRDGETIRRQRVWMPHNAGLRRAGATREAQQQLVRDLIRQARTQGLDVIVTVDTSNANEGAARAGYDVVVTTGRDLQKPRRGAKFYPAGSRTRHPDLDELDDLAADEGLVYE